MSLPHTKPALRMLSVACAGLALAHGAKPNIIVFYSDDHGYADLSAQGQVSDVRTPHIDGLAAGGALALQGYSTAPQCVPSRAGLMTGRSQNRFGVESNADSGEVIATQTSFAERLQDAGYVTAQLGKWHLGDPARIKDNGFTHQFPMNNASASLANIDLEGQDRPLSPFPTSVYHLDACSRAAAALVRRYARQPFFLYVAFRAPHVPLDAPKKYLDRFPGAMPERRRQALAMISAMDDGVGLIMKTLKDSSLLEKTLIFYVGDNGAPLKITKEDLPLDQNGWDGSLNDPLNGEKGTLMEGGMHVPFLAAWKGVIKPGQAYAQPVWTLDIAASALAAAGVAAPAGSLDGVDLIPYLSGARKSAPHAYQNWRWDGQAAVRSGDWKLLKGSHGEYLYNLAIDLPERYNLIGKYPQVANRLREELTAWSAELDPPGLAQPMSAQAITYWDYYLKETAPVVNLIPAVCNEGSYSLPGGRKATVPGIYLDTVGTGSARKVDAYVLPECAQATEARRIGSGNGRGGPEMDLRVDFGNRQVTIGSPYPVSAEIAGLDGAILYKSGGSASHRIDARGWRAGVYVVLLRCGPNDAGAATLRRLILP